MWTKRRRVGVTEESYLGKITRSMGMQDFSRTTMKTGGTMADDVGRGRGDRTLKVERVCAEELCKFSYSDRSCFFRCSNQA